jgi:hypothetical protein
MPIKMKIHHQSDATRCSQADFLLNRMVCPWIAYICQGEQCLVGQQPCQRERQHKIQLIKEDIQTGVLIRKA